MGYTTLAAVKAWAEFETDDHDDVLEALIESATAIIENKTKRIFKVDAESDQAFTRISGMQRQRFSGQTLFFYQELAEEASAITDSHTVTYLPEDGPPYYGCYKTDGSWAYPTVTVTGYWGYSLTPPADIEQACLRLVKWLYDLKDATNSAQAVVTPEGQVLLPEGLPNDIAILLNPYVKVTIA